MRQSGLQSRLILRTKCQNMTTPKTYVDIICAPREIFTLQAMNQPRPTQPSKPCDAEGVVKFALSFSHAAAPTLESIAELNAWRQILYRLGLIGREPLRYHGLAYGNVSTRTAGHQFIISGTQTGAKVYLSPVDYCLVLDFDLGENRLCAEGPVEPSSEALSHGAIYAANPQVNCVLHVHSPELWRNAAALGICQTDAAIAYGTPAMGVAVGLAASHRAAGIIAMGGHEDGIIAYAETVRLAALELVGWLAKAEEFELWAGRAGLQDQ